MNFLESLKLSFPWLPPGIRMVERQPEWEGNFLLEFQDEATGKTVKASGTNSTGSWVKPGDSELVRIIWEEIAFLVAAKLRLQGKPAPTYDEVDSWRRKGRPRLVTTEELRQYVKGMGGWGDESVRTTA